MADIDILDLNAMIIGLIAVIILYFVYRNKLKFSRYIPGLTCLVLIFVANSVDDYVYYFDEFIDFMEIDEFIDFIENVAIISGAFLLFTAALLELREEELKEINNKS